ANFLYLYCPGMDSLLVYYPEITGGGELLKFYSTLKEKEGRVNESVGYNVKLDSLPERFQLLIACKSTKQVLLPIIVSSELKFDSDEGVRKIFFGLYSGILFVMFVYNFIIYLFTKYKTFLALVVYIPFVYLTQANYQGFASLYFWENSSFMMSYSFYILNPLVGIAAIVFFYSFLNIAQTLPSIIPYLMGFIAIYVVSFVLVYFDPVASYQVLQMNAGLLGVFTLVQALRLVGKGYRQARFYSVSTSLIIIGVILFVLKDFGLVKYSFWTHNVMSIGSGLEVTLLSIALADRINTLKKEKEESQAQALEVLQENERIIKEQNVVLEKKVEERTFELRQSNSDLGKALDDLKQTQAQLVDAEKMASLGQMTAGIAHELNNPINFVSSNINPLKRDVQDVFEVIDLYGEINVNNVTDKLKEVDDLKEGIELDYVRGEIDQLLNGIADGAHRTAEIVKGLRVFSRLDEDALKKANINECLESTLVILRSNFKNQCNVVTNLDSSIPEVNCFPGKLNQVFMNVLNNAAHATIATGKPNEECEVNVQSRLEGNKIVIAIKDNGVGIKETDRPKIFDPFFTTKKVGEGTGLGLSIALGIMNDHNGGIEVHSAEGQGSEFIITLPIDL
ncbi:MAG: hypothetical protein KDC12_11815, partial [Flavobacteriales bacterium]|nr:hypothetical protein [Flavobacteriales bacterium]